MSEVSGDLDSSSVAVVERTIVDDWLSPLPGSACGDDLEYDNDFLQLAQAAAGKPETQFAPAEPPNWRQVADLSASLFERSRDLRVAMYWARARVQTDGLSALPDALRLLQGLLSTFWDELHPQLDPDDGDAYARLNVLALLTEVDGLLGDVRTALIVTNRAIGELRVRDIEIMLGRLQPREGESAMSRAQVDQMLGAAVAQNPSIASLPARALAQLKALSSLLNDRVGIERAADTRPMHSLLTGVAGVMPDTGAQTEGAVGDAADNAAEGVAGASTGARAPAGRGIEAVNSRADALKAIDLICDYLERTEPTNPAQLLLRRARRLINKNFLQLMRELAPDALNEVARIMGVDPSTIESEGDA